MKNRICALHLLVVLTLVPGCGYRSGPRVTTVSAAPSPQVVSEPLKLPLAAPRIVIQKSKRKMMLYDADRLLKTYRIGLGFEPVGDKEKEGDGRTPEGEFYVCVKNANSSFYLSLGLSYPNLKDAERGLKTGLINQQQYKRIVRAINRQRQPPWDTPLGGQIFIHGNGSSRDWTWGCVAVEDHEIKELFDAVPIGTRVVIEH